MMSVIVLAAVIAVITILSTIAIIIVMVKHSNNNGISSRRASNVRSDNSGCSVYGHYSGREDNNAISYSSLKSISNNRSGYSDNFGSSEQ